mmetsp:Transcript_128698/g.181530  ORF Transcript_128698/g.181530 Transcript_128698/m.181530 type:complete len:89 (+) Transcript_128698:159-425(+)
MGNLVSKTSPWSLTTVAEQLLQSIQQVATCPASSLHFAVIAANRSSQQVGQALQKKHYAGIIWQAFPAVPVLPAPANSCNFAPEFFST